MKIWLWRIKEDRKRAFFWSVPGWVGDGVGGEGQWCQENISCADDYYSDGEMNCSIPRLAPKV